MTILIPTARILVQRSGTVPASGEANFFVLPIADQAKNVVGLVSACDVEFSTTRDGTAAITSFQVANLHPDTVRRMADSGYVKVEAGYVGHPSRAPKVIFFGKLDKVKYRFASGKINWIFTAKAFPGEIWSIKPNASQPVDQDGKPVGITVGEAIRIIADRIGIGRRNVKIPGVFDGDLTNFTIVARSDLPDVTTTEFKNAVTLSSWTTRDAADVEIAKLMEFAIKAVQERFGVVRRFGHLPDNNDPFRLVIEDLDQFTGEFLGIDLDSEIILDAGPDESSTPVPAPDTTTAAADETGTQEPAAISTPATDYSIVTVFDPLVGMGTQVRAASKKLGISAKFKVAKGKHTLNGSPLRWRTEYSGQVETTVSTEVARDA